MHTVVYDGDSFNTQSPVSCQAPVAASAQQDEVLELPAWIPVRPLPEQLQIVIVVPNVAAHAVGA